MTALRKPRDAGRALLQRGRYFTRGTAADGGRVVVREDSGRSEEFYRDRWRHDREVRSTHGVNCTGSCSWRVFVRDGIVAFEIQATDYPATAPGMPAAEPRGCPRGAAFSWYLYNPARVRYPYVRGALLDLWREARGAQDDPVEAWASVVRDPAKSALYKSARGHAGFVRSTWDEVLELCAAAHIHTIREHGPDRVAGMSPIPAMSTVSQISGTRYLALTGGVQLSFYDWYADLPPASPQVFGDQTDVPESADWWNSAYTIVWGTNLPVTRTPDTHFLVEARYDGQKVVVVSPDYAGHVKFADEWLAPRAGTDSALAMAMGHVVLKEFYVERRVPYFVDYATTYTDLPFLVRLAERDGGHVPERFLTAADLRATPAAGPPPTGEAGPAGDGEAPWKTVVWDTTAGGPAVPNGSQGFRWAESGMGLWNLELGGIRPALSLLDQEHTVVQTLLPRFDTQPAGVLRRSVPAIEIEGQLVTTVFDLLLAQYGVGREGLPGEWPVGYEDEDQPYTPAWQERITGVPADMVLQVAREFALNAEATEGRSMILVGSGVNHWFHSDVTYRAILTLLLACGCVGRSGGGWCHYTGQEKIRPLTGWRTLASALDWVRPARQNCGTEWHYLAADQWRYETFGVDSLASPLAKGLLAGKTPIDALAQAERLGWQITYPTFDRNPLELADKADKAAENGAFLDDFMAGELTSKRLRFSVEDPDDPANWPRLLFVWRANLLGSSGKGHEYFLRHLIGSDVDDLPAREAAPAERPKEVVWRERAPVGKLDLLVDLDFRMTSTGAFADVILPAATWYEKSDLSCTDMHSYIHSFNAAVDPLWEARSDWDAFRELARVFAGMAAKHLGTRKDLVATAIEKDTAGEQAQPFGEVRDWTKGETDPVPGKTMPRFSLIRRDYGAVYEQYISLGPLLETLGVGSKGVDWDPAAEIEWLKVANGTITGRDANDIRASLYSAEQVAEAVLALSGSTNGRAAREGFIELGRRVGRPLGDALGTEEDQRIRWSDVQARPQKTLTSFEWSGDERGLRPYSAFTINVEHLVPWRTLTGRMQFFVDHEWMAEFGEQLPIYRPPLNPPEGYPEQMLPGGHGVVLRYLTPHSKWSIHTDFQDNLLMLTLFRGGPVVWMSPEDAEAAGIADNEWVEMWNRNGVLDCRAAVSVRIPKGVCFMYHAKDRHVQVPRTEATGRAGGTDNTLTRILLKPTHMIGGYSQLSYAINYYGCAASQRDEVVFVRRRGQAVKF